MVCVAFLSPLANSIRRPDSRKFFHYLLGICVSFFAKACVYRTDLGGRTLQCRTSRARRELSDTNTDFEM